MNQKHLLTALAMSALVALTGCGTAEPPTKTPAGAPAAPAAETKAPEVKAHAVGETTDQNGVKLTVNAVRFTPGEGDNKADEGYTYAIVEATVENAGQAPFQSNTLVQYAVRTEQGVSIDRTGYPDLKELNGEIAPGTKVTGEIAFQVPADAKGLTLNFVADLLKRENAVNILLGEVK
jgi:hypothetical protein